MDKESSGQSQEREYQEMLKKALENPGVVEITEFYDRIWAARAARIRHGNSPARRVRATPGTDGTSKDP